MNRFEHMREQYPHFIYHSYKIEDSTDQIEIKYHFSIVGLSDFYPTWRIPKQAIQAFDSNDEIIEKLVFSLGMVELISYWKLTCSPCVEIYAGGLKEEQILWWKKQYFYGLQEFFYTNKFEVDLHSFMQIKTFGNQFSEVVSKKSLLGCMVPIGGGKDSNVSLELIKKMPYQRKGYIINPRKTTLACADVAGLQEQDIIQVYRKLDLNMLKLNQEGFFNGHTPFSALVAFSSTLLAYLNNIKYVVLSNEDSANESTVKGCEVNHQYSKSYAFEKDFQEYERTYIQSQVYYFSLLRGWSEYQIAQEFAKHKDYFPVFKSCNVGSKQDIWCANCSKCLFVYIILSPFLSPQQLVEIFHENLLEKETLLDTFEKLIGLQDEKPFECVGSRDEVNVALCKTIYAYQSKQLNLPNLLAHYITTPFYQTYKSQLQKYEHYFNLEHSIPEEFLKYLR